MAIILLNDLSHLGFHFRRVAEAFEGDAGNYSLPFDNGRFYRILYLNYNFLSFTCPVIVTVSQ